MISLGEFNDLMQSSRTLRQTMVGYYLINIEKPRYLSSLEKIYEKIKELPHTDYQYRFSSAGGEEITVDLNYELSELEKDIEFFRNGEDSFYDYLASRQSSGKNSFSKSLARGVDFLDDLANIVFISDRDGTVNNYCARYQTSVQSAYNAIFLTRFSQNSAYKAVILTSAPLENTGLIDINVSPEESFIFAGSKGREYAAPSGERGFYPIPEDQQEKLKTLNEKLSELVHEPEYTVFSLIGSGLQFKFGQTTLARQDIFGSIDEWKSRNLFDRVKEIIREVDPEDEYFRIEDTGKDIEIMLTVSDESGEGLEDFNKGHGVLFLDDSLSLGLSEGPNLICGDTKSDVPMVRAAMEKSAKTRAVFVGADNELQKSVEKVCSDTLFLDEPDLLVSVLNEHALEKGKKKE